MAVSAFKNFGERSSAKNYCPASLFSVVSTVFEKILINSFVDHLKNVALFLISSIVLDLLN